MKFNRLKSLAFSSAFALSAFSTQAGNVNEIVVEHDGQLYSCIVNQKNEIVNCQSFNRGHNNFPVPEGIPAKPNCHARPGMCG